MKTPNKTFIINTYTEDKYRQLSANASDKQLHIVDNDNLHRTVVPSYDLLVDKVKLSLGYDVESTEILLNDVDGNVISRLPAKRFISDNYLMSAAYDDGKLVLSVTLSNDEVNAISVDFPVDQSLDPLSAYAGSTYPIASKAVAVALSGLSACIGTELGILKTDISAADKILSDAIRTEVERATAEENAISERLEETKAELTEKINNDIEEVKSFFDDKLATEAHDRFNADQSLGAQITAEAERAEDIETKLDEKINETSAGLIEKINDEKDRAVESESEISSAAALSVQNLSSELMPLIETAQQTANLKTTDVLSSEKGRSRMFNEYTGGGAKVEDTRGINSFVGTNLPDIMTGAYGSMYVLIDSNGPRLKMFKEGFNYKNSGPNWYSFEESAEIATRNDLGAAVKDYALSADVSNIRTELNGADDFLSAAIKQKVWIEDAASEEYAAGKYGNLSVVKIAEDEYMAKVYDGTLMADGVLYVISSDHINAYGQKIVNVVSSDVSSDAANVQYVNSKIDNISATVSSQYLPKSALNDALSVFSDDSVTPGVEEIVEALRNIKRLVDTELTKS